MSEKKKPKIPQNKKSEPVEKAEMKLLAAPKSLVPAPIEKPRKKPSRINTPMETQHFIYSQVALLVSALLFLGGMYWVLNNDNFQTKFVDRYLPVTLKHASSGLEISSPDDELLTFSNSLLITGTTSPKSSVIIAIAGSSDYFNAIESDTNGVFQQTVTLAPGLNRIEISSFDSGDNPKTIVRTVYFSEEKLQ